MSVFYRDIDVNISDYKSELSKPLIVYERDRGLEIYFNLIEYAYRFDKKPTNLLEDLVGAYATVTLVNPSGDEINVNEVEITEEAKVKFVITEDLTDELTEIGTYQLQIHVNNDVEGRDTSVFSVPPFNFEVIERLKGRKNQLLDSEGNGLIDKEGYQLMSASSNRVINFPANKINEYLGSIPAMQGKIKDFNSQLDTIEKKTKISITDYGAKGDGLTDNTSTIQSAINKCLEIYNTTNVKCCLYIPKGKYKISNYLELRDSSIDIYCDGEIFQDVNCKYGFKFYNMKNMELKINISSNATVENFVQSTAISEQVNGLIVGVQLLGCQRVKLDMNFNQFYGRGIESIGSWQFNNGRISGVVGQAIFIKKPTAEQIGLASGIGELGHYYVEELTGSYFNGLDISVTYYENYIGYHSTNPCSKGVVFEDCTSLWLGDITIGCTSNDYMISFLECNSVHFNHLYSYGNWSNTEEKNDTSEGILIKKCFNLDGNIHTLKCKGNALTVVGLRNSKITWFNFMSEKSGVIKNASDYDVSGSEISLYDRFRYGVGLYLNNDSNGRVLTDGLKLTVNVTNQIASNTHKEDLIINDPNAIVDVRGRMINAKFVKNNNIRQYATITTLSGAKAKFDFNNMLTDYWTDFTPSITWNTGTPTGITTYCRYKQIGKTVFVKLKIHCDNANGTDGFTDITLPLPIRKTFYNIINPYCIIANTTKRTEYYEINYSPNTGKMRSYFASPVASESLELYLDFVYETD